MFEGFKGGINLFSRDAESRKSSYLISRDGSQSQVMAVFSFAGISPPIKRYSCPRDYLLSEVVSWSPSLWNPSNITVIWCRGVKRGRLIGVPLWGKALQPMGRRLIYKNSSRTFQQIRHLYIFKYIYIYVYTYIYIREAAKRSVASNNKAEIYRAKIFAHWRNEFNFQSARLFFLSWEIETTFF